MTGGWTPGSEDRAPRDTEGSWDDDVPARDSWADAHGPTDDRRRGPVGSPVPVVVLAAGGGAVVTTALGLLVLLLGGVVVAVAAGAIVLLAACALGSAYLRGAR